LDYVFKIEKLLNDIKKDSENQQQANDNQSTSSDNK